MSTIKVNKIENTGTTDGGVEIDSSGHVQVDGLQIPTAGALSNRNLVINGNMRVAQRSTSKTGVGGGFAYTTVDRFTLRNSGTTTARYTNTQSSDAPDNFGYSYKLETTTARGTLSTTHYQGVATRLEGQNLQNLGYGTTPSKYLTLSFWVKSNTTGQYSCHFSNWNGGRNISKTYTINSANTWEQKSITIPGDSTAIADDNALGMEIGWVLATGSFYNDGTDGSTWHNTSDSGKRHSGQSVAFGGTIGDTWYLTGVQLEVGEKATPFEHRSYGDELSRCQRYFHKSGEIGTAGEWFPGVQTHAEHGHVMAMGMDGLNDRAVVVDSFPTTMRAPGAAVFYPGRDDVTNDANSITVYNSNIKVTTSAKPTPTTRGFEGYFVGTSTDSRVYTLQYTVDSEL